MSKQELLSSYKTSLNLSLIAMTMSCMGLFGLLTLNNQDAIRLFFYQPLLFAGIAGAFSFLAIPVLTILVSFVKNTELFNVFTQNVRKMTQAL